MANSRELTECVAASLGRPMTAVKQHMRNLREADKALVTTGGRGLSAARMTHQDAATLICAVLGSEAVQNSVETVSALKKLLPTFQGRRTHIDRSSYRRKMPVELGLEREHDIIEGLVSVLKFFDREDEFRREMYMAIGGGYQEIYVSFEIEYPEFFGSLTVGIRDISSESWIYGRRQHARTEQIRRCRGDSLREIAACLRTP
jgi:hypothetical protein